MSVEHVDVSTSSVGMDTLLFLDTTEILEPEVSNVRPWSTKVGDTEAEIKAIEALAATIEEEGQIQPVKVRWVLSDGAVNPGDGHYELIAGRRRKKAIELINAGRKTGEELKVKAILGDLQVSDASAFRQAAIENWHRAGLSPMDMVMNIETVREKFGWKGSKGTKKVAEFFKVSAATVTQYERLGKLSAGMQEKVHVGEISRDVAFTLADIAEKKGPEAAEKALNEGEAAEKAVQAAGGGRKKQKAAKGKAVKKAARAEGDVKPRSKSGIMEFFTSCYGPAYGYPNGAMHQFVGALEKFAHGELSERTLYKYWDACVGNAEKGTPEEKKDDQVYVAGKPKAAKKKK